VSRGKTPDTHYHLYVHSCGTGDCPSCVRKGRDGNGFYLCHRCGTIGRFDQLGGDEASVDLERYQETVARLKGEIQVEDIPEIGFPEGTIPMTPYLEAWRYLVGRGLSPGDIGYYRMGVGTGRYRNRVLVPTLDEEGRVVFWVGRTYGNSKRKYDNPTEVSRNQFIFNLHRAVDYGWIVVTEGVFSAITAGRNAVATFGKKVSDQQVMLLVDAYRKNSLRCVVAALDGDAQDENYWLAERLHVYGCTVFLVSLPEDKDPDDLGREEFSKLVVKAPLFSPMAALKARVEKM
jgi:hypothetical protein